MIQVRRTFWLAVGLGAGATIGVMATRWMRRRMRALAPSNVASQAAEVVRDLAALLREAGKEFRLGMQEREAELRDAIAATRR